jgi:hypothetical protein
MRIFISWSGERSRVLAQRLEWFVRNLIHTTEPWVSTGIDKGSRWEREIASNLEQAGLGIVCLTSDTLESRWLLFEAGALAKKFDDKVCTFLLDVEPAQVQPPLGQFQHTRAEKADVWALIQTINKAVEAAKFKPRVLSDLEAHFEMLWKDLERTISELRQSSEAVPPPRGQQQMIVEVLDTVRDIAREVDTLSKQARSRVWKHRLRDAADIVTLSNHPAGLLSLIDPALIDPAAGGFQGLLRRANAQVTEPILPPDPPEPVPSAEFEEPDEPDD